MQPLAYALDTDRPEAWPSGVASTFTPDPAHARLNRHNPLPRNKIRRSPPRSWAFFGGLAGAIIFIAMVGAGNQAQPTRRLLDDLDALAARAGFGIDRITLAGYRFTLPEDLFDALDLGQARSQIKLDHRSALRRMEQLPWIEQATLIRRLPDGIDIRVRERIPAAVLHDGERRLIIDKRGQVLGPVPADLDGGLLPIRGAGAEAALPQLIEALSGQPLLAGRIQTAHRISGRRWTLDLDGGTTLVLPSDDRMAPALQLATRGETGSRLIDLKATAVDLRTAGTAAGIRLRQVGRPSK